MLNRLIDWFIVFDSLSPVCAVFSLLHDDDENTSKWIVASLRYRFRLKASKMELEVLEFDFAKSNQNFKIRTVFF